MIAIMWTSCFCQFLFTIWELCRNTYMVLNATTHVIHQNHMSFPLSEKLHSFLLLSRFLSPVYMCAMWELPTLSTSKWCQTNKRKWNCTSYVWNLTVHPPSPYKCVCCQHVEHASVSLTDLRIEEFLPTSRLSDCFFWWQYLPSQPCLLNSECQPSSFSLDLPSSVPLPVWLMFSNDQQTVVEETQTHCDSIMN